MDERVEILSTISEKVRGGKTLVAVEGSGEIPPYIYLFKSYHLSSIFLLLCPYQVWLCWCVFACLRGLSMGLLCLGRGCVRQRGGWPEKGSPVELDQLSVMFLSKSTSSFCLSQSWLCGIEEEARKRRAGKVSCLTVFLRSKRSIISQKWYVWIKFYSISVFLFIYALCSDN